MPDKVRAERFRQRAEELRSLANDIRCPKAKEELLRCAREYERLSEQGAQLEAIGGSQ